MILAKNYDKSVINSRWKSYRNKGEDGLSRSELKRSCRQKQRHVWTWIYRLRYNEFMGYGIWLLFMTLFENEFQVPVVLCSPRCASLENMWNDGRYSETHHCPATSTWASPCVSSSPPTMNYSSQIRKTHWFFLKTSWCISEISKKWSELHPKLHKNSDWCGIAYSLSTITIVPFLKKYRIDLILSLHACLFPPPPLTSSSLAPACDVPRSRPCSCCRANRPPSRWTEKAPHPGPFAYFWDNFKQL